MLRLAATPWPVIIFWGVILLLARAGRKKVPTRRTLASLREAGEPRAELGDALQRAMEKLRQAERESQANRTRAEARARPTTRPEGRRIVLEDHSTLSQETEPEVVDYDDEAAQLEEKRVREAAEAFERVEPGPSVRPSVSPAVQPARAPVRRSALRRFGDGSLKGAVILSEILGLPKADR